MLPRMSCAYLRLTDRNRPITFHSMTAFESLDCLAALGPTPRIHRHRYFGVPARTSAYGKLGRWPPFADTGTFDY
jgi:hypothetical protein